MMSKRSYDQGFIGQRFGRLTVTTSADPHRQPSGLVRKRFQCRCDCGEELITGGAELRNGRTQSCGCLQRERTGLSRLTHGDTAGRKYPPEYNSWKHLTARCENRNNPKFKDYGGRGIRVCARWKHGEDGKTGYACFLIDMGRKPSPMHSIDRIDNDGNYEPNNCRWATSKEQRANQRPRNPGTRVARLALYALSFGS